MMETTVNNSMCRCCASEGAFKDVKSTYHWMGEEEIYADMLRDCFNINLNVSEHCDDGGICEVCITQLRNAINFKKQVLHTEEQFKKHVQNKTLFRPNIVKVEVQGEDDSDDNASGDDGLSGAEYDVPIKTEDLDDPKPKKRAAKTTPTRAKKAKTDNGETSTKRGRQKSVVKQKLRDTEPPDNINTEKKTKITPRTEILKHRSNIKEVLLNSNATPIRRYGGVGYTCCFCENEYADPGDLKKHTLATHADVTSANFMTNMNMSEYVVKLDITDLKCNICSNKIETLDALFDHLQSTHRKTIFNDINSHIFPVKFGSDLLRCVICSNTFNKFRMLVKHMHIHYRNYVCAICDSGFVNRNALKVHSKYHETGVFKCDLCPKILSTQVKKRWHIRSAHSSLVEITNKCAYCKDTFKDYWKKEAHLASVHGVVSVTPVCQACDKVFNSRRMLRIHIKRDHLLERSHKCSECDRSFFSPALLKNHMVTHTGLKEYKCSVCMKAYARKDTLNAHMRKHEDLKRLKCAYVKAQMMKKHGDIV